MPWVFNQGINKQCHLFCCGLWLIWSNRNQFLYENKISNSRDISRQIISYNSELHGLEEKLRICEIGRLRICEIGRLHNQDNRRTNVIIHFDAAFDQFSSKSTTGLVVRDRQGEILASKSVLHLNVTSSFAAEAYVGLQAVRLGISLGLENGISEQVQQEMERIRQRCPDWW